MKNKAATIGKRFWFADFLLMTLITLTTVSEVNMSSSNTKEQLRVLDTRGTRTKRETIGRCEGRTPLVNASGYPPLTKDNITVVFMNKSNSYSVRINWTTPKAIGKLPFRYYFFYWMEYGIKCFWLTKTTNSLTLTEKDRTWDSELAILIHPQPQQNESGHFYLHYNPVYIDIEPTTSTKNHADMQSPTVPERTTGVQIIGNSTPFLNTSRLPNSDEDQNKIKILVIVLSGAFSLAVIIALVIITLHYRRKKIPKPPKTVHEESNRFYVSYCPESESFMTKVIDFTTWFRKQGYDVQMDVIQNPSNETQLRELGRFRFGEIQLHKSKNVFMILSPSYLRLCKLDQDGETDVGKLSQEDRIVYNEIRQIRDELCSTIYRNCRFIPVLFGVKETELPFWIKELVVYKWPDDKLNKRLLYRLSELVEYTVGK